VRYRRLRTPRCGRHRAGADRRAQRAGADLRGTGARRAEVRGDAAEARRLERALALFEECATLDEPARVLAALPRG
jgi:hypothetical protein